MRKLRLVWGEDGRGREEERRRIEGTEICTSSGQEDGGTVSGHEARPLTLGGFCHARRESVVSRGTVRWEAVRVAESREFVVSGKTSFAG